MKGISIHILCIYNTNKKHNYFKLNIYAQFYILVIYTWLKNYTYCIKHGIIL